MKVLIQRIGQELYLDARNAWTTHIQEARDFKGGTEAINYAVHFHLEDVELHCAFPNPEHRFCPIT
jgi:hypothetical protein